MHILYDGMSLISPTSIYYYIHGAVLVDRSQYETEKKNYIRIQC